MLYANGVGYLNFGKILGRFVIIWVNKPAVNHSFRKKIVSYCSKKPNRLAIELHPV